MDDEDPLAELERAASALLAAVKRVRAAGVFTLTAQRHVTASRRGNGASRGDAVRPPADTKLFLDWFQIEYTKRRKGAKYFVRWDKHSAIIKRLLHLHDLARLKTLAIVMLESNEEWIERTDRGVEVLSAKINWLEERLAAWEAARAEGGRAC